MGVFRGLHSNLADYGNSRFSNVEKEDVLSLLET